MKASEFFMYGFSCSESIIKWASEKGLVPEDLLCTATAFSSGMSSGCLCGAIAGSQIVLDHLYGRENRHGNDIIAREKAKELIEKFVSEHKATCCRALTFGMDMESPERKEHCSKMLESCQQILEEMVAEKVLA